MVQTLIGAAGGTSFGTASATRYAACGDSTLNLANATEADVQITCRVAGTASLLSVYVGANTRSDSTTVTFRKNNADTALTLTIGAGVTGLVQDNTHSVSLADGDTYCIKVVTGGGTGALTIVSAPIKYVPSSGSAKQWSATHSGSSFGTASSTRYQSIAGLIVTNATEGNVQIPAPVNLTMNRMQVYVQSNARSSTTVFTARVNGADGTQTFNVGAGAAGLFEDNTHSDNATAGQGVNIKMVTGTGSGSIVISRTGMKITTDGAGFPIASVGSSSSASSPFYSHLTGEQFNSATESEHHLPMLFAATLTRLSTNLSANSSSTTLTVAARINAATGNNTFAYSAGATGITQDSTHSDALAANDNLDMIFSGHDASVNSRASSAFLTEIVSGVTVIPPDLFHQMAA